MATGPFLFAWYNASATASLSNASQTVQVTNSVSTTTDTIPLKFVVSYSITGNPVLVGDNGHESVWVGDELKDLDGTNFRPNITRYATVTASVSGFATGTDAPSSEAKAAAIGKTYSGIVGTSTTRFAIHANSTTLDGTKTSGWLTSATNISLTGIKVEYNTGTQAYSISSDTVTFKLVVSGGQNTDKDWTLNEDGEIVNTLQFDGAFQVSSVTQNS